MRSVRGRSWLKQEQIWKYEGKIVPINAGCLACGRPGEEI